MQGKVNDAVRSDKWMQYEDVGEVVGWEVNTNKAMDFLSKHPEVILNPGSDPECITFIMQSGMAHYKCELMGAGLPGEGYSALMIYR